MKTISFHFLDGDEYDTVKTIIGWDDVLCRPIYKSTTDMNASIAVADRNVTDKDGNVAYSKIISPISIAIA